MSRRSTLRSYTDDNVTTVGKDIVPPTHVTRSKSLPDFLDDVPQNETVEEQKRRKARNRKRLQRNREKNLPLGTVRSVGRPSSSSNKGPRREWSPDSVKKYMRDKKKESRKRQKISEIRSDISKNYRIPNISSDSDSNSNQDHNLGSIKIQNSVPAGILSDCLTKNTSRSRQSSGFSVASGSSTPSRFGKEKQSVKSFLPGDELKSMDILIEVILKLPEETYSQLHELGITIIRSRMRYKRPKFSDIPKSSKHNYKNNILNFTRKLPRDFVGFSIGSALLNVLMRLELDTIDALTKLQGNGIIVLLNETQNDEKLFKSFKNTDWPAKVEDFMQKQPISRQVPGQTVSISYGVRKPKFLRNFTLKECHKLFKDQNPEFGYKLSVFSSAVPKNVIQPSEREVVQNVCTIHSNVRKMTAGLNNKLVRLKKKDLMLPLSSRKLIENIICNDHTDFSPDNVSSWKIECCIGKCSKCGVSKYIKEVRKKIKDSVPVSAAVEVSFSSWQRVEEDGKQITKLVSRKVPLDTFFDDFYYEALSKFPMHVRVMIQQWDVFKSHVPCSYDDPEYIKLRTREDFQQDLKVTIREETVGSHRGQGKISMVLYPMAVEVIDSTGANLHALTYVGEKLEKSYVTVHTMMLKAIEHFESMYEKKVKSYERMTDGCSSQFWAYGSCASACELRKRDGMEKVVFNRYAPNEGKSLSDAIGGQIKSGATRGIMMRKGEEMDINSDDMGFLEVEELEFEDYNEFYTWLVSQIEQHNTGKGPKFKTFEIINVESCEIDQTYKVDENDINKFTGIKSYHCMAAVGDDNLYFRRSTCICNKCDRGNYDLCERDEIHGKWVPHNITKSKRCERNPKVTSITNDESEEDESDTEYRADYEIEYESSDCSDDEAESVQLIRPKETAKDGDLLITKATSDNQKQYVAQVWEIKEDVITCKFLRRDFSYSNEKLIQFYWPNIDDIGEVSLSENVEAVLDKYTTTRRGRFNVNYRVKYMFKNLN